MKEVFKEEGTRIIQVDLKKVMHTLMVLNDRLLLGLNHTATTVQMVEEAKAELKKCIE